MKRREQQANGAAIVTGQDQHHPAAGWSTEVLEKIVPGQRHGDEKRVGWR